MDLLEAIRKRRSVREYTGEPVDDTVLRELIEAAVLAPSAINQQPWTFVVIKDADRLAQISRKAKSHLLKASLSEPAHSFREMLNDPDFDIFYHAPALVVIAAADPTDWAVEDCALAAENLMLAAYPATYAPIAPIVVGHPRRPPPPVPRKNPDILWIDAQTHCA
jgi:nitroreductase